MIIPKNILKFWGVFFIILAVALGVITLIYRWHRIFPTHEVSEIYSRYAKEEGIDAAFVKDYRVNDSVTVDVTVLEATTDSAWLELLKDFNATPPTSEVMEFLGENAIFIWAAPKTDYRLPMDSIMLNNDLISTSWSKHQICIFCINTIEQLKAIQHNQYEESVNQSK